MNLFKNLSVGSMSALALLGALLILMAGVQTASAQNEKESVPGAEQTTIADAAGAVQDSNSQWALFFGVALTVGTGCVSAGYAVAKVGAAALGAASEKPEILGRALIFVGLAEGIAIYGLIVGLIMLTRG